MLIHEVSGKKKVQHRFKKLLHWTRTCAGFFHVLLSELQHLSLSTISFLSSRLPGLRNSYIGQEIALVFPRPTFRIATSLPQYYWVPFIPSAFQVENSQ